MARPAPTDALFMWVVYDHPPDLACNFAARRWEIAGGEALPTEDVLRADDLESLRALLPPHLLRMPRSAGDAPLIVETWF